MGGDTDAEAEVQAFIAQRRGAVLGRAVDQLEATDESGLDALAHRLDGTLGSYGLDEARAVVAELRRGELDRAVALARLRGLAEPMTGVAGPGTAVPGRVDGR